MAGFYTGHETGTCFPRIHPGTWEKQVATSGSFLLAVSLVSPRVQTSYILFIISSKDAPNFRLAGVTCVLYSACKSAA